MSDARRIKFQKVPESSRKFQESSKKVLRKFQKVLQVQEVPRKFKKLQIKNLIF